MKKIFQILCILTFFLIFWYTYWEKYWDFHETVQKQEVFKSSSSKALSEFRVEDISPLWDDILLWSTPSKELLEKLVDEIDNANSRVYVEVYIFTERDLRDALIRAHKRGVEVKILLENNPYKAPYLNDAHHKTFVSEWLDVRWSDPLNYSLNHAKLLIIDERAYVATWNFSYSTFTKNRDFFVELQEEHLIEKLTELFMLDFQHTLWWVLDPQLVVSPYSSRGKIESLIRDAEISIDFYFPYMADDGLTTLLSMKRNSWVVVRGIVGESYVEEEGVEFMNKMQSKDFSIVAMKSPKLHAKALLIDKKYLYIGSINFSTYSLDENREVGLIIKDGDIIKEFLDVFESDF